jgi:Flp pilus assembly protein TadD
MEEGKLPEAAAELRRAVELSPELASAHYNYATLLMQQAKLPEAVAEFTEAVRLKPVYPEAEGNLGVALMTLGQSAEGLVHLKNQARFDPQNPGAHFNLALALAAQHQSAGAAAEYRQTLALNPNHAPALSNLAWLLATDPSPEIRDGALATQLAQKSCELTQNQQPTPLLSLAAAQAETGQFTAAVATTQKAIDLAKSRQDTNNAVRAEKMLAVFQSSHAFREPSR